MPHTPFPSLRIVVWRSIERGCTPRENLGSAASCPVGSVWPNSLSQSQSHLFCRILFALPLLFSEVSSFSVVNTMTTTTTTTSTPLNEEKLNFLTKSKPFRLLVDKAFATCDGDKTGHVSKTELYAGLLLVHRK